VFSLLSAVLWYRVLVLMDLRFGIFSFCFRMGSGRFKKGLHVDGCGNGYGFGLNQGVPIKDLIICRLILMSCRPVPIRLLRDLFLHDSLFF
jgi:hypothetical protein